MSTIGASYAAPTTYAAPTSYAAPTMSYAAPTTYAAPQMSYAPQATYGGYPGFGAATASPYLDTATITQQEKDATAALTGQADTQLKMLTHQYAALQAYVLMDSNRTFKKSGVNVSMNHS